MARSKKKSTSQKAPAKRKTSTATKGTSAKKSTNATKKRPPRAIAKPAAASEPPAEQAEKQAAPRRGRPAAKKETTATAVASTPQGALALGVSVNKRGQTLARAAAKENRKRTSGTVRIQANASSRNRRKQGKRDDR